MFTGLGLVLVGVVLLWFLALRRAPQELDNAAAQRLQTRWIIAGGLALPLGAAVLILAFGIPAGHGMLPLRGEEALRIEVTGRQWWWEVRYPDSGVILADELHLPLGQPVDIHLTSADVVHSFWVPRLAGKLDAIPGHVNVLRLRAEAPGIYLGQCSEFCGLRHAHMQFSVHVHAPEDFRAWLEAGRNDD